MPNPSTECFLCLKSFYKPSSNLEIGIDLDNHCFPIVFSQLESIILYCFPMVFAQRESIILMYVLLLVLSQSNFYAQCIKVQLPWIDMWRSMTSRTRYLAPVYQIRLCGLSPLTISKIRIFSDTRFVQPSLAELKLKLSENLQSHTPHMRHLLDVSPSSLIRRVFLTLQSLSMTLITPKRLLR